MIEEQDVDVDEVSEPDDPNSFILDQIEKDQTVAEKDPYEELEEGLLAPREINLDEIEVRRRALGYRLNITESDVKRKLPSWARNVTCPQCGYTMTPLKSRKSQYGEIITYQCHRQVLPRQYCLNVMQLTVGNHFWMRPGDFISSDYDWTEVAPETVFVLPGDSVIQSVVTEDFLAPVSKPQNPWERKGVQSHVVWDVLWTALMEEGVITIPDLIEQVQERHPKSQSGKMYYKLVTDIEYLDSWVTKRSGYIVKTVDRVVKVYGKTKGDLTREPYSLTEYRREHQLGEFEGIHE